MPLKIVFMGTPDFAVPSLEQLVADDHAVVGVFCQPDRPKGRGMTLLPPPVKKAAGAQGIPVFQPETLKGGKGLELLRSLAPDLVVVVAYGRILPPEILEFPRLGCINLHASLLPRWRGAAPIQWSLIAGDEKTGVTTMHISQALDTGDIILKQETDILENETSGELFERLSQMGANLLGETVFLLSAGKAPRTAQDDALATLAPPIQKSMAKLDFSLSPRDFCNLVRGLNPAPGGVALFAGQPVKIHRAIPAPDFAGSPGEILHPKRLIVGCGKGAVELVSLQPQGKKPMDAAAWRNGIRNLNHPDEMKFS